jgi:acyl carrier protein
MPEPDGLRQVVASVLDIPLEQVTPDLGVGQVEAWDSFGHLQIILALESEYNLQFDPQKIPQLTTVALLQQELERRLTPGQRS